MTNREAIEEIKNYENYPNGLSKKCRDYIIKALERDPTTKDCITRQSVLDKIQRLIDAEQNNIDENGDYMNYARERVNAYEAIQFFVENDCLCPSVTPQFSSGLDKNSKNSSCDRK